MRLPRMTARRWFWSLTLLLALYLAAALRMDAGKTRPDPLGGRALQAQNGVAGLLNSLLLPASWSLGKVQGLFTHGPRSDQQLSPEIAEKLQKYDAMVSELDQLQTELKQRTAQLRELKAMLSLYPSLSQASWIPGVNVVGRSASAATDVVTLDIGASSKVQPGMLVIANFAPVGQVISVGPTSTMVRLISDRKTSMRIQASIKRITPGNPTPQVIADSCEVEGLGDGRLFCRSVSAYSSQTPLPGDIVVVNKDSTWRALDGARIGEIEKVDRSDQNALRFELAIHSYADLPNLRQVWVVLMQP